MIRCLLTKGFCLIGSTIQGDQLTVGVALANTEEGFEFTAQTLTFVDADTRLTYLVETTEIPSPAASTDQKKITFGITPK